MNKEEANNLLDSIMVDLQECLGIEKDSTGAGHFIERLRKTLATESRDIIGGPSHDVAASLWHWIAMYGPNIHIAHGNRLIHLKNGLSNPANPDDYCDDPDCQICNDIKMANP